ncbi:MAG: radical SAM protein [Deltaproteobacteria bacterium]|nr:radical SAM protein [Deltaproteobacteria bacterium]
MTAPGLLGVLGDDLGALLERLRGGPSPGLHPFQGPDGSRWLHLRVHTDGTGTLLVDASAAVHLDATAVHLAWLALRQVPSRRARAALAACHPGAPVGAWAADFSRMRDLVDALARHGTCAGCAALDAGAVLVDPRPARAPTKADLVLTYACQNACSHCYNEPNRRRTSPLELSTGVAILDRLADVGVCHVVFTGGEPTLHPDVVLLVRHAVRRGLVVGLNTNGRRLSALAVTLADAGLDHVQVTLASARPEVHDAVVGAKAHAETVAGLAAAVAASGKDGHGPSVLTNTTLTRRTAPCIEETVDLAADLGVRTVAVNGMIASGSGRDHPDTLPLEALEPTVIRARDRAEARGLAFLWYTPTPWCRLSPVVHDLGPKCCNAAEHSICVEPDGAVLPCQSWYAPAGNLLTDPWTAIWDSPAFRRIRERRIRPAEAGLPERCHTCPDLPACGGGCGLEAWAVPRSARCPM